MADFTFVAIGRCRVDAQIAATNRSPDRTIQFLRIVNLPNAQAQPGHFHAIVEHRAIFDVVDHFTISPLSRLYRPISRIIGFLHRDAGLAPALVINQINEP